MEENKRHIDDFLRDELGNYTETPPPAVWDDLEKRLDTRTDHKGFDFRKWWWFIPALLFVAGGTFLAAHKWNQKPAKLKETVPAVIDTAAENTFAPANVYRDTAAQQIDTKITQPAIKPADSPAHIKTNTQQQPAAAQNTTKENTTTKTVTAPPNNDNATTPVTAPAKTAKQKTAANNNSSNNATMVNATTGDKHTTAQKHSQADNNQSATAKSNDNNTVNKDNAPDNTTAQQPKQQKKQQSPRNKQASPATAADNNMATNKDAAQNATATQSNPVAVPVAKAKKQKTPRNKQASPATVANNNTIANKNAAQNATVAQDNPAAAPVAKAKKQKAPKNKQASPATVADNSKAINNDAAPKASAAKDNPPAATVNNTKKQTTVTGRPNQAKQKIAVSPAVDGAKEVPAQYIAPAAKPQSRKLKQPAAQKPPVTAKNNTPAVNKAPKATNAAPKTTTAKAQKQPKQAPVATANTATPVQHKPEATNTLAQQSPVQEKTKDQDYTFKSRTETKVQPETKNNLDLSDKQAEAEADTTADHEMDPYASLNPPQDKHKPKLEGGIKAAYTYGFSDFALNKISVLPYVQLNINTKLSVALHLGFSYGQMNKTALDGTQSYYKTDASLQTSSFIDSLQGQLDTFYNYHYTQLRDSFSVKHTTAKSVWEIELPVVFKYNLSSSLSIFGGPVFTFSKVIQITEDKSQTYQREITDSIVNTQNIYNVAYFNNLHQPSGAPDSTFSSNSKPYENAGSTPVRLGYTVGLSYDAGKRFVIDLSLQQMLTSPNFIPNETLRKVYTQPYVRLAVGFRIFK